MSAAQLPRTKPGNRFSLNHRCKSTEATTIWFTTRKNGVTDCKVATRRRCANGSIRRRVDSRDQGREIALLGDGVWKVRDDAIDWISLSNPTSQKSHPLSKSANDPAVKFQHIARDIWCIAGQDVWQLKADGELQTVSADDVPRLKSTWTGMHWRIDTSNPLTVEHSSDGKSCARINSICSWDLSTTDRDVWQ